MMTWIARFAVLGAVLCGMALNVSYALTKATGGHTQLVQVAVALTIDLAKCALLGVVAELWVLRYRFAAIVAFVIWLPCIAFSTFSAYSMITTNRTTSTAVIDGRAQDQARQQAAYNRASADLTTAKASPLWSATGACTSAKDKTQRTYCENIGKLQQALTMVTDQLGPTPTVRPDPELETLRRIIPVSSEWLTFLVTVGPAIIIELLASVGSFVVRPRINAKAPGSPTERKLRFWLGSLIRRLKSAPQAKPVAPAAIPEPTPPAPAKRPGFRVPIPKR